MLPTKDIVSEVSLFQNVHIPPKTVQNVEVFLQSEPDKIMVLQPQIDTKILIPSYIFHSGKPIVQTVNDTDIGINVQSNHVIGSAIEVDTILSDNRLTNASANQEKCSVMPETNSDDQECSKSDQSRIMQVSKETNRINLKYPLICKLCMTNLRKIYLKMRKKYCS